MTPPRPYPAYPVPPGATARRLEWSHLPPWLRGEIERILGSPVIDTDSRESGFTPGMASVLTCADGSRHFVKAASEKAQRVVAQSYRDEAAKHEHLPAGTPAPELVWIRDADAWIVLGFEYVESRAPGRPWTEPDLASALRATTRMAQVLTPPPAGMDLASIADDLADLPTRWDHVRVTRPDLPHLGPQLGSHLEEAAALAAGFAEVSVGDTLVHTDLRDDNLLLRPDGTTLVCDWNGPVRGADWIDTAMVLIGPRGDGIDVERVLAEHPLTRKVPAESIDRLLALLTGYFLHAGDQPVPQNSPYIRAHQRWEAEVCWDWLGERRGWS